jgi:hypothetical protein
MGALPVPAWAFALFQDLVDGALRAGQAGDRDQLRPAEVLGGGLRPRRPDEQPVLAVPRGQGGQRGRSAPGRDQLR